MSFTVRQLAIIKGINDGKIVDLDSCLEVLCVNDMKLIDKNKIEELKKVHYQENLNRIDEIMVEVNRKVTEKNWAILDERMEQFRNAILDYSVKSKSFQVNYGAGLPFLYLNKNVYEIQDDSVFDDFKFITNYLHSEGLAILRDENQNAPKRNYVRFFCKLNAREEVEKSEYLGMYVERLYRDQTVNNTNIRYGYYEQDVEYLDFKVEVDNSKHNKYEKEFFKTIICKPELKDFIKRGFINRGEYDLKKTHLKTNIAILISFIIGIVSIWTSISISSGNTKFWKENELLEEKNHIEVIEVLEEIKNLNSQQLDVILNLDEYNSNNESKELTEMLNELKEINTNLLDYIKSNEKE